jgi:hypothetical protein
MGDFDYDLIGDWGRADYDQGVWDLLGELGTAVDIFFVFFFPLFLFYFPLFVVRSSTIIMYRQVPDTYMERYWETDRAMSSPDG